MTKPRLLVVSHVLPFPGSSGQQQRVRHKLDAFREHFHVSFLTVAPQTHLSVTKELLASYCDEPIVLPASYAQSAAHKFWHGAISQVYWASTGLKSSNYIIGKLEFSSERLANLPNLKSFDVVVYEYWHAVESARVFQDLGIPCVLDMHDILWKSYQRQLEARRMPNVFRKWKLKQYHQYELTAWEKFDALIAINDGEYQHIQSLFPEKTLFYAPMGIDTTQWRYSWQPSSPPRIAYYGGLGNPFNQNAALQCYERIMPLIWQACPEAELWIIGSNPPRHLQELASSNSRVHVTGFVENIQDILKTVTAVLCPFHGQFGFRSRLIEVMALGIPVIATPDAVHGMNLEIEKGLYLNDDDAVLADWCVRLIQDRDWAYKQSLLARQQVEDKFSFDATYSQLANDLYQYIHRTTKAVKV